MHMSLVGFRQGFYFWCYTAIKKFASNPSLMAFTYDQEPFGSCSLHVVTHEETKNQIAIIPEFGARLNSFKVHVHGETLNIIDGYPDSRSTAGEPLSKGSLLAPFPNRVADGKYAYRGEAYQLPINKEDEHNAIHGFMSTAPFALVSSQAVDDYYELSFKTVSEGCEGYPFSFALTVTYRFSGVWLEVDTELTNTGQTSIPAGFGWHPYFKTGSRIDSLVMQLPTVEKIEVDDRLIPTGKRKKYEDFSQQTHIRETELDTGFHFLDAEREVQLVDESLGLQITLSMLGEDNSYEYLQVYTPEGREAIALEPMTCAADAFNNGMGLRKLPADKSLRAKFTILVS